MGNQIKVNTRRIALEALLKIEAGEFSHVVIKDTLDKNSELERIDRAFIKRLITGTNSYKIQLDYILGQFINKDLCKLKPAILQILRMAVYQMLYMDSVPDNAACNEAVKLTEKKGLGALKGFVNGVLRNIARNKDKVLDFKQIKDAVKNISVTYSMPEWLVKMWVDEYGTDTTKEMAERFLEESFLSIRVNTAVCSVDECTAALESEKIEYEAHPYVDGAFIIKNADNISKSKAFEQGYFQIQDISSMLVGVAASYEKGMKVLDICAAPGGKSTHAASVIGETGLVLSNDLTEKKVKLIEENAKRLKLDNIKTTVSDACVFIQEYEEAFDVVIADVPCSGLGVIGRKSDIKYRVTISDIEELCKLQKKILENAVRYVKKGGTLMFSTCTVNHRENNDNFMWLKEACGLRPVDFSGELKAPLSNEASVKEGYLQLIPGKHLTDGFFVAKFCKEEK